MKKIILVVCLLTLIFGGWLWQFVHPPALFELWMLNVGQGESVLVREPGGKTLLFDGGPDDSVLAELGGILPPWQHQLDLVVLSHLHADHIRGLISVFGRYSIGAVWYSGAAAVTADTKSWLVAIDHQHLAPVHVHAGFEQPFGALTAHVFFPLNDMTDAKMENAHDADVVLGLRLGDEQVLLNGDLNEAHEAALIANCLPPSCNLHSVVMQVPHHGSLTGLTPAYLAAVHPDVALIPVGLGNKFHHPRPEIIQRLKDAQIPIRRTDTDGRIHLTIGREVTVESAAAPLLVLRPSEPSAPP